MTTGKQIAVLVLAAMILLSAAARRGFEYDEAYSVFVTSPTPRPTWPSSVFRAGDAREAFTSHAGPLAIAQALRRTDVHPPLYFWALGAWRWLFGDGLMTMRLLSVLCALAALVAVGAIARTLGVPAEMAMLLTAGCYAFTYTGTVARGFALAQVLELCGVLAILRANRAGGALIGGLLLGAATFTNYLSAFAAVAALSWLAVARMRRRSLWLSAGLGFAVFLPADLWFFLAQRASRAGQFPSFRLLPGLARLGEYGTAALFGGLPLYVDGPTRAVIGAALGMLVVGLGGMVAWRWRRLDREARWLLLAGAGATPIGLLLLGACFGNTPIELRYLCFATPFAAMLLAGALQSGRGAVSLRALVLGVQALALAGLILRPETMQPARMAAWSAARLAGADAVVLLPRGNDGVGVVGPFLAELPDATRVLLVGAGDDPEAVLGRVAPGPVVVALLGLDADSKATLDGLRAAFRRRCWRPVASGFGAARLAPECAGDPRA